MVISEGLVPPLLGAATVLVIYCFAKTLFNKSAGVVAGLLASFSQFLIFRTMKGLVFHDSFPFSHPFDCCSFLESAQNG
jgi:asparagine N-glycosylation enzyme membrane subunit Stt3